MAVVEEDDKIESNILNRHTHLYVRGQEWVEIQAIDNAVMVVFIGASDYNFEGRYNFSLSWNICLCV